MGVSHVLTLTPFRALRGVIVRQRKLVATRIALLLLFAIAAAPLVILFVVP